MDDPEGKASLKKSPNIPEKGAMAEDGDKANSSVQCAEKEHLVTTSRSKGVASDVKFIHCEC